MKIYTKNELKAELARIRELGYIQNARKGNDGGIGNTLEDLLGIKPPFYKKIDHRGRLAYNVCCFFY